MLNITNDEGNPNENPGDTLPHSHPPIRLTGLVVHACNPGTREVKADEHQQVAARM